MQKVTGQETCSVAQDPLRPLVVEWPGTNKTELDVLSQQGPVVVSYAGCVLKVLSGCKAGGTAGYEMVHTTPTREVVTMADENELRARLPLGVASLKGELGKGSGLELEYVSVGQRLLKDPPKTLANECGGATHYVQSITVGAYSLSTVASDAAKAGVDTIAADVGFAVTHKLARLRGSGEPAVCASSPGAPECQAVLQIGLSPLSFTGDKVASGGFGVGLGAVPVIPKMGALQELSSQENLTNVDVELLRLLQAAKRADRDSQTDLRDKANAWKKLAAYNTDTNSYRDAAMQRHEQWMSIIEAKAKLTGQVRAMCVQRQSDFSKLKELLALDEDVVSVRQKQGFERDFQQVYAPWKAYIPECQAISSMPVVDFVDTPTPKRSVDDGSKPPSQGSTLRTIGTASYVLSGLSLATGVGFGVASYLAKSSLDETCPDRRCPASSAASAAKDLDSARAHATRSTVFLGVGGALFVTGLVFRISGEPQQTDTAWSLQLSPLGMGVSKEF